MTVDKEPLLPSVTKEDSFSEPAAVEAQTKKGHIYLKICCDTRRAVSFFQYLSLAWYVTDILQYGTGAYYKVFDPSIPQEASLEYQKAGKQVMILSAVGIGIALIVILGEWFYNMYLIGLGLLWSVVYPICYGVTTGPVIIYNTIAHVIILVGVTIASVFKIYAEAAFFYELKSGIMSRETYYRENFQFCS